MDVCVSCWTAPRIHLCPGIRAIVIGPAPCLDFEDGDDCSFSGLGDPLCAICMLLRTPSTAR